MVLWGPDISLGSADGPLKRRLGLIVLRHCASSSLRSIAGRNPRSSQRRASWIVARLDASPRRHISPTACQDRHEKGPEPLRRECKEPTPGKPSEAPTAGAPTPIAPP